MKNLLVISAFAMLASTAAQAQTAPADCFNLLGFCLPAHQEQNVQIRRGEDDNMMAPMMMETMKDMSMADMPTMDQPAAESPAGNSGVMN